MDVMVWGLIVWEGEEKRNSGRWTTTRKILPNRREVARREERSNEWHRERSPEKKG